MGETMLGAVNLKIPFLFLSFLLIFLLRLVKLKLIFAAPLFTTWP
jgi:hypothetical protein